MHFLFGGLIHKLMSCALIDWVVAKDWIYISILIDIFVSVQPLHTQTVMGIPGQRGRFGLTLASPADLNGDRYVDVVVGAPLEENGQGSIYIFNGRQKAVTSTFSQVREKHLCSFFIMVKISLFTVCCFIGQVGHA